MPCVLGEMAIWDVAALVRCCWYDGNVQWQTGRCGAVPFPACVCCPGWGSNTVHAYSRIGRTRAKKNNVFVSLRQGLMFHCKNAPTELALFVVVFMWYVQFRLLLRWTSRYLAVSSLKKLPLDAIWPCDRLSPACYPGVLQFLAHLPLIFCGGHS